MEHSSEIKTDFLRERISQNENFQTVDINKWAFSKLGGSDEPLNILELCCGTGKQTDYLVKLFPNSTISCLDASPEAIESVKDKFSAESSRMHFYNTQIDKFFDENQDNFDVVFCSYGLYYAADIDKVLLQITNFMNPKGRLIVMGPYGDNNKQIFDVLKTLKVTLPELVVSSSSTFMYEKVLATSITHFEETHVYTTQNNILWSDVDSVLNYWKNSTFYKKEAEQQFKEIVEKEVKANNRFVNTKKIMLIEAIKA